MQGRFGRQWMLVAIVTIALIALFLAGCNKNIPLESYARPQQDAPQWRIAKEPPTRFPASCKKNDVRRGEHCVSTYKPTGLMTINVGNVDKKCSKGLPRESLEYPGGIYRPEVCTR